jgi:hypothetical protein
VEGTNFVRNAQRTFSNVRGGARKRRVRAKCKMYNRRSSLRKRLKPAAEAAFSNVAPALESAEYAPQLTKTDVSDTF